MHIAIVSDWESSGGANIAALRLTEGFAAAGHRVTRIYQTASTGDPRFETRLIRSLLSTHEMSVPKRLAWRMVPLNLHRRLHQRSSEAQLAEILDQIRPDVINVHNLHIGGWSPEMVRVCADHAPVVCKLCDTWMFTGRCYNPGTCEKYLTACDHTCPTASEYPALSPREIRPAFELRREILSQYTNIAAVAPSRWMGRLAVSGLWKDRSVFRIPNGIDLKRWAPMQRQLARRVLGLDREGLVVLSHASEERKKGFHLLIEALSRGVSGRVQLLLFGGPIAIPRLANVDIHSLGFITHDRLRALAYNCADVYVHPSMADNSPNTVIESLACGTPVVAFPVDGVTEMVLPGRTGWLASGNSADFLRTALGIALEEIRCGVDLRESCRAFAETEYDMPSVVRQWERVFSLMSSGQAPLSYGSAFEHASFPASSGDPACLVATRPIETPPRAG